jgi:hypothetical protein
MSWAHKNNENVCTSANVFDKCFLENQESAPEAENDMTGSQENSSTQAKTIITSQKQQTTLHRLAPDIPALTDNMSGSEQGISEHDAEDNGAVPGCSTNHSDFLYNSYTSYTSGSIDRDARIDLGTSRCSSGGREDRDDHEVRRHQSREE